MKTDLHLIPVNGVSHEIRLDIFSMDGVEATDVYGRPRDLYRDGGWRIDGFFDGTPIGTKFYSGLLGSPYWGQADSSEVAREFLADAVGGDAESTPQGCGA